jgi:hypothetical protein
MFGFSGRGVRRVALFLGVLGLFQSSLTGLASVASAAETPDLKKEIEAKIVSVQQGAAPKLKVGPATCPAKLAGVQKKVPIGTYTCTVQIEGVSAPYTVVVSEGGFLKSGVYKISPARAIIDLTKVVGFVRDSLDEKEAAEAKIVCGKGVVAVQEPNSTIVCTVTVAGTPQNYTFVVKDVNGTIALRTSPSSSTTAGASGAKTSSSTTTKPGKAPSTTKKA